MPDNQKQKELVTEARGLARWFSIDIKIKIFGVTIWEYHFPPQNQ